MSTTVQRTTQKDLQWASVNFWDAERKGKSGAHNGTSVSRIIRMTMAAPCGTTVKARNSQSTALDGRKIQLKPAMSIEGAKDLQMWLSVGIARQNSQKIATHELPLHGQ